MIRLLKKLVEVWKRIKKKKIPGGENNTGGNPYDDNLVFAVSNEPNANDGLTSIIVVDITLAIMMFAIAVTDNLANVNTLFLDFKAKFEGSLKEFELSFIERNGTVDLIDCNICNLWLKFKKDDDNDNIVNNKTIINFIVIWLIEKKFKECDKKLFNLNIRETKLWHENFKSNSNATLNYLYSFESRHNL